jgi:hypothetical protein
MTARTATWPAVLLRAMRPQTRSRFMNAPSHVPRPPRAIEDEMAEAGRTDDDLRLSIARAAYVTWLAEVHGIYEGVHGSEAPEEAWQ